MKLVSWNVNGLRAVHRNGYWEDFLRAAKPDIIGLQEVKGGTWTVTGRSAGGRWLFFFLLPFQVRRKDIAELRFIPDRAAFRHLWDGDEGIR
jgi:hypothetical protein